MCFAVCFWLLARDFLDHFPSQKVHGSHKEPAKVTLRQPQYQVSVILHRLPGTWTLLLSHHEHIFGIGSPIAAYKNLFFFPK